ncbi:MAG TPA: apolipoprotein N-acyltransferase, partial [Pseudomonas sp.]|nr:apolipoprotein N-acyltransferase [Pseudomonas sp.]
GEPLKVMTIQGNVPQNMKWDPEQLDAQLSLYRDLTFQSKPADLIVWPETAVPILKERASGYLSVMDKFANDRNAALITGVPLRQANAQGDQRYYNAVTVVGQGSGDYLKQKLVP